MINIEMPEFDLTINKNEYSLIPEWKQGLYFMYNAQNELLYIGQSMNLKQRVTAHFRGNGGSTLQIYKEFERCSMFYEDENVKRNIYEYYFMNVLKPSKNKLRTRSTVGSI